MEALGREILLRILIRRNIFILGFHDELLRLEAVMSLLDNVLECMVEFQDLYLLLPAHLERHGLLLPLALPVV